MHDIPPLVVDLAIALGTAAVITLLFRWLKLPVVFGYLVAGLLVGPNLNFPLLANSENVHVMSELGIILIMFGIGLEFSVRKVVRSGPTALLMSTLQAGCVILSGLALGKGLGWSTSEAVFMGCAMVATSTVVIVKLFEAMRPSAALKEIVFAVTILHDLFAIILMTVLVTITKVGVQGLQPMELAWTIVKFVLFLVGVIVIGRLFVPKFLRKLADHEKGESLVIASIGFCFCVSILAVASGFSLAIGAFAAGMLAAESGRSKTIDRLIMPIRDVFTSLFFVAVGMMLVPSAIVANWGVILLFVLLVILANAVALTLAGLFAGQTFRTSFQTGIALGQFGEFAFVMMGIGVGAGIVRPDLFTITVSVSVMTALTSSVLFKHSGHISDFIESRMPEAMRATLALYQVWASSLRSRGFRKGEGHSFVKPIIFLLLDGAAIVGLVAAYDYISRHMAEWLGVASGLGLAVGHTVLAVVLGIGTVFMVAGMAKQCRILARQLAVMAPNPEATSSGRGGRHMLASGLAVALLAVVWLPLVSVLQAFVPATPLLLTSAAAFVFVVIAQIYRVRQLSHDVSIGTEWLLSRLIEDKGELTEVDMNRTGSFHSLRIVETCPAIGRSLSSLDLGGRSGVEIVALMRDSRSTPLHPSPVLMAHDRLVLVGNEHSLAAAKVILFGKKP